MGHVQAKTGSKGLATKIAVSVGIILLLIGRSVRPEIKDALDATGLTLLAVAVVPWLGPIFETIKVAGVEAKFREVEKRIQDVQATAEQASGRSAAARRQAELVTGGRFISGDADVDALAREYEQIRKTMAPSGVRTEKMAGVVSRMMSLLESDPAFPAATMLESSSLGDRLSSYAYYLVQTRNAPVARLIEIVGAERRPFNQYWGLEAIGHVVADPNVAFDRSATIAGVSKIRDSVEPGSDRRDATDRILATLEAGLSAGAST